ncbi:hypothetical protein B296_00053394 [Ensete ventricosum]|uniref:Uncharacterized protein n=1 Tax=Ensete ventricosum TaxID=4639 RepID=A0A426Y8F3_ENSVE|nr:hypothetical protein B296_00053394 [Ensete ventricosum]
MRHGSDHVASLCRSRVTEVSTSRGWCVGMLLHCVAHVELRSRPREFTCWPHGSAYVELSCWSQGVDVSATWLRYVSHMELRCQPRGVDVSAVWLHRIAHMELSGKAPYLTVHTGLPADLYVDRPLPVGTIEIDCRRSIEGERRSGRRRRVISTRGTNLFALFFPDSPARSVARYVGKKNEAPYALCISLGIGYRTEMNSVCRYGPVWTGMENLGLTSIENHVSISCFI